MAVSTTTTFNDLVGSIVSANAQSAAYANRVFRQLVRGEAVPPGFNNITIPRFQALTTAALSEGVAPSSSTWSSDGVVLTPVEYGVYVQISKSALHGDPFSDLAPYGDQIGRAIAQKEDDLIIAAADFTEAKNVDGDALTVTDFLDGVAYLEASNAPGPYFAVFHPYSWSKLRKQFDADTYGPVGVQNVSGFGAGFPNMNSYVGSPYGIPCFISSRIAADGSTPTARDNLLFSREALGCAWVKDIGVDVDDNVVARAIDLMGWMSVHCDKLVDTYGVRLLDTLT